MGRHYRKMSASMISFWSSLVFPEGTRTCFILCMNTFGVDVEIVWFCEYQTESKFTAAITCSLSVLVAQSYNQSFNIHKFYKYSNFDHFIQWILNDMIKHFSMKNLFIWALVFISTRHITWIRANKISIRYVWTWKLLNPQRKICGLKNFGTPVDVAL